MTPPLRAVFFDLGKTLIYPRAPWGGSGIIRRSDEALAAYLCEKGILRECDAFLRAFQHALETYYERRENHLVETTTLEILRAFLPPETPDSILHAALAKKYAITQENWRLEADALPTLRALRREGYRLALLSNAANDADVHALLRTRGLAPFFHFAMTSAACGYRKPHPCLFERALAALDLSPQEVAMVGDTLEADILGANRLGMVSIWIRRRVETPSDFRADSAPDAVISALSELPPLLASLSASSR